MRLNSLIEHLAEGFKAVREQSAKDVDVTFVVVDGELHLKLIPTTVRYKAITIRIAQ